MKYISQVNAFWNWVKLNELPSRAGYLYFALLDCANAAGWKSEFSAPNSTLQAMAGLDKNALHRYRNILVQLRLIRYTGGKRGQAGTYQIIPLYDTNPATNPPTILSYDTNPATNPDTNPPTIPLCDTNPATNMQPILQPVCNQSWEHTKEKEKSKTRKEIKEKERKRFAPPTVEEVAAYCRERRSAVDPQRFVDFYTAKDWMIGKNRMKDWKAALRGWEGREAAKPAERRQPGGDGFLELLGVTPHE